MTSDIIKVSYPKDYFDGMGEDNQYEKDLEKITGESFANASTTNTLKHIKASLAKSLRKNYNIKDKDKLTKLVSDILSVHGLSDKNFDPMSTMSRFMSEQMNDVSIDDNGNKDSNKAIRGVIKESELSFDKLIGYDYLYRTLKELYGKDEATRISGEMYDYSLALHDSTKTMIPYSYYGNTPIIIKINGEIKYITLKNLYRLLEDFSEYKVDIDADYIDTTEIYKEFSIEPALINGQYAHIGTQSNKKKINSKMKSLPVEKISLQVWDTNNGWVNITQMIRHKNKRGFTLYQLEHGDYAMVTDDHPVYMQDGGEKNAGDLKIGDEVLFDDMELPQCTKNIIVPPDLAYFLGFTLGDGSIEAGDIDSRYQLNRDYSGVVFTRAGRTITLYQNDIDNSHIKSLTDKLFDNPNYFKFSDKSDRCIAFSSYDLLYMCSKYFGYTYRENSFTKHLPENFLSWTDESQEAFVAGLVDADGSISNTDEKNRVNIRMMSAATINGLYDALKNNKHFYTIKKRIDGTDISNCIYELVLKVSDKSYIVKYSQKVSEVYNKYKHCFEKYNKKLGHSKNSYIVSKIIRFKQDDIADTRFLKKELDYVYDITTDTGRFYANGMISHNCWALDSSKIVMEGRPFGMLKSKPAKSVDSYLDCLCDSIPELANHIAGALACATLFLDITHLLIYKQRVPLKKLQEDKTIRKYLENRFQKFIHSVNHPTRDGIESPFTNVSIFDKEKLHGFIGPDNYGWYFPKNIKVLADNELGGENGKISREEFDDFVVEYITEVQKIFIDFFDKGDPSQNGMQYRFPVTTINMSKHWNEEKKCFELDSNNELLNYITKKDIARYNIFCSEGSKICSCCRMINDKEMMDSLGSTVNSFGGSGGASLGSHRAVTINFARIAYEANSYDDFKKILKGRVDDTAKILKAHKLLLIKLGQMGLEPFIDRGWLSMNRFFSTFGVNGIYEADIILKEKFGQLVDDYRKDILIAFNEYYRNASKNENIAGNAEQVPAESMSPKLFKVDNMLFGNPYNFPSMYANQFVPTWEKSSIREKFTTEGKYDMYLNGGSICHIQIGSDLTPTQARNIIKESVIAGCEHFALNAVYSRCKDCGEVEKARWEKCPHCQSDNVEHLSRVVGFFVVMENINKTRKENDWLKRKFVSKDELSEQLGN